MKNNLALIIVFASIISIAPSCKKEMKTCQLGKYYLSDGNSTPAPTTFSYYNDGRLKTLGYSDVSKDLFTYVADTIYIRTTDYRDSLSAQLTGLLNSNNAIISSVKNSFDYFGNTTATEYAANEYNADGNLTKQTINNAAGTTILVLNYTAGSATTGTFFESTSITKRYIFYRNLIANKTGIADLSNVLSPLTGKSSATLLDSMHVIRPILNDTIRVTYAHSLDENNYVSKTVETYLSPGFQTKYHTYQYFNCR